MGWVYREKKEKNYPCKKQKQTINTHPLVYSLRISLIKVDLKRNIVPHLKINCKQTKIIR